METKIQPNIDNTEIMDNSIVESDKFNASLDTSIGSEKNHQSFMNTTTLTSDITPDNKDNSNSSIANRDKSIKQQIDSGLTDVKMPKNYKIWLSGLFHVFFKATSIICYLSFGMFFDQMVTFVMVTICAVFDFWVVKNVSGRMLVG